MIYRTLKQRFFPVSISSYGLGFMILLMLVTSSLTWLATNRMTALKQEVYQQDRKNAQIELAHALSQIVDDGREGAEKVAHWDESKQQLGDAKYYGYWRDNRVHNAGVVPSFIETVELYDTQGRKLGPAPSKSIPARIPLDHLGPYIETQDGQPQLFYILPIHTDHAVPQHVLGYALVRLPLMQTLTQRFRYRHIDPNSLVWRGEEGERASLGAALSLIGFGMLPHPEIASLENIVNQHMFQIVAAIALIALLFYSLLMSLLGAPLRHLSQHIDALRTGRNGATLEGMGKSFAIAELEKVRLSLNQYQHELDAAQLRLDQKNSELWLLAHHDPLTRAFNRRAFDEDWAHIFSIAAGRPIDVSFILFDCDHFKAINDTYGHQIGDLIIQGIADSLRKALPEEKRLYRLGGDEFAVLLLDSDPHYALAIAEACQAHCCACDFSLLGVKEPIRLSLGLAHADGRNINTLSELPKQADMAMYLAKRPGQHKIVVFNTEIKSEAASLISSGLVNTVYHCISSGQGLEMHYQPIVKLPGQGIEYYEALARMRNGDALISASQILPIVETHRLEPEFDQAVILQIRQDLALGKIPAGTGVSINLCGPTLALPQLATWLAGLEPYMASHRFVLEITESSLITQLDDAARNLQAFRQQGFKIALDDFGSGYSSLQYLAHMPVDLVKFDISMIRNLGGDPRQRMIVENLTDLILKAGYDIVAEGIESAAILEHVLKLNFTYAQCFLFGTPQADCLPIGKAQLLQA